MKALRIEQLFNILVIIINILIQFFFKEVGANKHTYCLMVSDYNEHQRRLEDGGGGMRGGGV